MNLIEAAEAGDIKLVKSLLDQGADVNYQNELGKTALIFAAYNGHEKVVELLLMNGARIDQVNYSGNTALILSAAKGYKKIVETLLKNGAKIDQANYDGNTALMLAVRGNHEEVVELLLANSANSAQTNTEGYPALMFAVLNGNNKMEKLLLDSGMNEEEIYYWQALIRAAHDGNYEVIERLLNRSLASKDGYKTPKMDACSAHERVLELLLNKNANKQEKTALIIASENGNKKVVEFLLNINPHSIYQLGVGDYSALMFAAMRGHQDIVKILLCKGAKIDQSNYHRGTALTYAAYNGHDKVVELLLKHGANVDKVARLGGTALMLAAKNGHNKVVKLLLDKEDFTADYIVKFKGCILQILDAYDQAEKITVLANLIAFAKQEDKKFIADTLKLLNAAIVKFYAMINISVKTFRVKEKIEICQKLQYLKFKTKTIDQTESVLKRLLNKFDDKLIAELKVSYDKISDIWGRFISKEKLTRDPAQKIASYLTDDELESVCEAVPYKYAIQILKSTPQEAVQTETDEDIVDGSTAVLGVQEAVEELPA